MNFSKYRTKAMQQFLQREEHRVTGLSIEADGVFIYTDSDKWHERGNPGCGTFRADSETAAIRKFYDRVVETHVKQTGDPGPAMLQNLMSFGRVRLHSARR